MTIKKHLEGGTLRSVMATEIIRVLTKYADDNQVYERAALELGITPRTLRVWRGPVAKGGWEELQPKNAVECFMGKVGNLNEKRKQKKRPAKTA